MRQIGAAIAPLMEEFFKDTGFDRKHHNFHYTPGLLLSEVEDPLKYIEHKKKLFDQVYPKQYVTGNELTTIKENSGIQGLIIATGTLDSGIDVSPMFINFGFQALLSRVFLPKFPCPMLIPWPTSILKSRYMII